jgi:hypothetical protein
LLAVTLDAATGGSANVAFDTNGLEAADGQGLILCGNKRAAEDNDKQHDMQNRQQPHV